MSETPVYFVFYDATRYEKYNVLLPDIAFFIINNERHIIQKNDKTYVVTITSHNKQQWNTISYAEAYGWVQVTRKTFFNVLLKYHWKAK